MGDSLGDIDLLKMYQFIRTHSQLITLHRGLRSLGKHSCITHLGNERRFETFQSSPLPAWSQLNMFVSESNIFLYGIGMLFGAETPHRKLDEAFRQVSDYLIRCYPHSEGRVAAKALKLLLDRGASLDSRAPHDILNCERYPLSALIELDQPVRGFPLRNFSRILVAH